MPRAGKRSGELGAVTTTPLVPAAAATNGPDDELRKTNLQRKYTLEDLYAMRQILLATLPSLTSTTTRVSSARWSRRACRPVCSMARR
jgi:hypothetical protein